MEDFSGRAWIETDLNALRHNAEVLSGAMPEGCELMAVLKANAYGHGAVLCARELERAGVRAFAVASAGEGAELRRAGLAGEILVLGYTHPSNFEMLYKYGLSQTVVDAQYARLLGGCGERTLVHLAVDTGMHRLGVGWNDEGGLLEAFRAKNLEVRGMFTHLCADESRDREAEDFTLLQRGRFTAAVKTVLAAGFNPGRLHVQSSYGLINYPQLKYGYVRAGIALYGLLSSQSDTSEYAPELKPAAMVKARISSVREIAAGESAGYGLKFMAKRKTRIASLAIGYADGLPRALSCGAGGVLIEGGYAPIVGQICMDQTMVDVTDIPQARQGAEAVIIGRSGGLEITAGELAEQCGTISNEILSRLGARLPRVGTKSRDRRIIHTALLSARK